MKIGKFVNGMSPWLWLVSLVLCGNALAQLEAEQAKLQAEAKQIDAALAFRSMQSKTNELAKQFQVPTSSVADLRNKGRGWGEIAIQLSMANHLTETDSKAYPTLNDAMQKVESLRSEGKGWGNIAQELGFKLGPVINEVKQVEKELRVEERASMPQAERTKALEKAENEMAQRKRMDRSERKERSERFDHPERPDRLEHLDRPEHADRPEKPQKERAIERK